MPRVAPAVLALAFLSSCGGAPMADTTLRAPEPGRAVLLLYVGANTNFPFFSNNTVVTTAGDLNIIAYSPQEGVRTDGAMARFSISSPLTAGFRAVSVQPGTYAILGLALYPLWSMCLNKGSLAF